MPSLMESGKKNMADIYTDANVADDREWTLLCWKDLDMNFEWCMV